MPTFKHFCDDPKVTYIYNTKAVNGSFVTLLRNADDKVVNAVFHFPKNPNPPPSPITSNCYWLTSDNDSWEIHKGKPPVSEPSKLKPVSASTSSKAKYTPPTAPAVVTETDLKNEKV